MSTKSAHEELKECNCISQPLRTNDLIRRAIAEHEAVKKRAQLLEEAEPVLTDKINQLQSKLTAYEKQWTDMHETICKFQEENSQLKKKLEEK